MLVTLRQKGIESISKKLVVFCFHSTHPLLPTFVVVSVDSGMDDAEEYFTPPEVARRLRVNRYTIRRWIHTGALEAEAIREGKRTRYRIKKNAVAAIERRDPEHHRKLV